MHYAVIMAGGIGSRFWPKSRQARPKQFLNVFGDATLIQNTVARLHGLIPPERCLIVTHERYVDQTKRQLPAVPDENILAEPISRNTAPCIAYAATKLAERDPDATMVVLPADHVIRDVASFHDVLKAALEKAQTPGALVTIGIEPTYAATGYGYIQYDDANEDGDLQALPVKTFAEKPDEQTATRFLDSGDFLWNSGMFIWRADTIQSEMETHLPDCADAFKPVGPVVDTDQEKEAVAEAFQNSPRISIDYGVMERSESVFVVPGSFGWNDVGDWKAVYEESQRRGFDDDQGNVVPEEAKAILHNSSRCLVQSDDRLVVLVGIHDTVVVDTDDAILVCDRENAQQVKNVVDYLHSHQLDEYV